MREERREEREKVKNCYQWKEEVSETTRYTLTHVIMLERFPTLR